ncbi:hypothetical protein KBC55_03645 [Patescibacteria group bacterium]|jgi:hypothetical protein|nr:hypothetical protein [Patescibacteria group bacterium]
MSDEKTTGRWFTELTDKFQALMRKYDMPEDIEWELQQFVVSIAKDQYRAGNRSGISWIRKQMAGAAAPVPTSA